MTSCSSSFLLRQRDGPRVPNRSHSPQTGMATSPTDPDLLDTAAAASAAAATARRPTFFSRNSGKLSPQKGPPLGTHLSDEASPVTEEDNLAEEGGIIPSDTTGSGFVLVESPNSKARAMKALQREREEAARKSSGSTSRAVPSIQSEPLISLAAAPKGSHKNTNRLPPSDTSASLAAGAFPPVDRVKGLPTPPIGPVLPDFDDLVVSRTRSRGRTVSTYEAAQSKELGVQGEDGLRRKTSVVKKLREKMK